MNLTPQERRELLDLLEQLSQAIDGNALWPGQIRDILRELHARVVAWLGDTDENGTENPPPPHHDQ
ncbi:hypothetical protein FHX37_3414 [Haloactinospora alba]|uniref:Uncharacterized protein n=1 Tax=Haloactinospora alba TaxID=405555 RepID=A0A543NNI7_9ACTN|nr:hypothetical protein [Haloactinospora alba]TQN33399.1 hypothetical protein FHX37_3414 [Haloactinospora alba]